MKVTVRRITLVVSLVALMLFILASIWIGLFVPIPSDPTLQLEYYKFVLDVYKAIGIGFLISFLGILIPNILPEAKYEFDRLREGREIYSKAKTGIDYLPFNLSGFNFRDGIRHIEDVHQLKHLADIYIRDSDQVGMWPYDPYKKIEKYRNLVTERVQDWDSFTRDQKLKILLEKSENI